MFKDEEVQVISHVINLIFLIKYFLILTAFVLILIRSFT